MAASNSIPAPRLTDDDAGILKPSNFEADGGDNHTKTANTVSIKVPVSAADDDIEHAKISGFETAASYNWLDELTPTILVPGIPPVWNPPSQAPFLKPDSGPRYIDQNADRNPASPMAGLIRAVQSSKPDFDFAAIDIITDRRPIRKLYGFIAGDGGKPFAFGVTMLENTALFTRMEDRTRDEPSCSQREYRQAFETAYLKIPLSGKDSTSHHRVVRYVFGGMTFLVRSAIDAYLRDRAEEGLEPANGDDDKKQTRGEELTDFVKAMSLGEPAPSPSVFTASVAVIRGGRPIPHAATLELSTRSKWKARSRADLLAKKLPDLWISQTAHFMEAYHGGGGNRPHANGGKWRKGGAFQSSTSNGRGQSRPTGETGRTVQSPTSHPTGNARGQWHSFYSDRGEPQPHAGNWKGVTAADDGPPQSNSDQHLTRFTDIEITPLATQLLAWEAANAKTLGVLVVMIKEVIEASKKLQGPCIVSCDGKKRVLEVRRAPEGGGSRVAAGAGGSFFFGGWEKGTRSN